jgi:SAM-dependent methyltransferase
MINTFGPWADRIPQQSLSTTINYVITGGTINSIELFPEIPRLINFLPNTKVLDFGCGVGRNAIPLALKYQTSEIWSYDNPQMINQMKEYCTQKYNISLEEINNIHVNTNWSDIKDNKFDCVYATLVFQHIHENALSVYLQDIKKMTNYLIVHGRRFNDDSYKNTWQIIENNGLYPINTDSYKKDGDHHEHQMALYKI